jgi:hypothetical protein
VDAVVAAGAGFLLAVLWFDLMFDVQVRGRPDGDLPESVLASIAGYYRRVTTDASPMNRLVAAMMLVTVGAIGIQALVGDTPGWVSVVSAAAVLTGVGLAASRTVPRAVRLGSRRDPAPLQSALARSVLRDHLACLAAIATLLVVQLAWA